MTTDLSDPFAATASAEDDEFDPFATADDAKSGGPFVPWPAIEAVQERLVVLVPKTFDPEAKVSDYLQKTYQLPAVREEWRVDLVVLNGGDLAYTYRAKVDGKDGKADTFEEREHEVPASELPYLIPGWRVSWANMIGVLNKVSKLHTPLALGYIKAGYSAKEMRAGKTFADFKAEEEAYYAAVAANPRAKIEKPRARWHFEISETAADKALALAWWRAAKADGYTLS